MGLKIRSAAKKLKIKRNPPFSSALDNQELYGIVNIDKGGDIYVSDMRLFTLQEMRCTHKKRCVQRMQ